MDNGISGTQTSDIRFCGVFSLFRQRWKNIAAGTVKYRRIAIFKGFINVHFQHMYFIVSLIRINFLHAVHLITLPDAAYLVLYLLESSEN